MLLCCNKNQNKTQPPSKSPKTHSIYTLFTFNLSNTINAFKTHLYTKTFSVKTVPYIFALSWITDHTHILSNLFAEKGLSIKSACILCSISMKWHCQTHLLTIQLYFQKYWDKIDDRSSLMLKHKLLPAVCSHLALVKFYCGWLPVFNGLYGQRRCPGGSVQRPASLLLSLQQQEVQELCRKCTNAHWVENVKKWTSDTSHELSFTDLFFWLLLYLSWGANTITTQSTWDTGTPRFYAAAI